MGRIILDIQNLRTSFRIQDQYYPAVDGVSLQIKENEVVAIVGESGCGKSALALSLMGLHHPKITKMEGEARFNGKNLLSLPVNQLNKIRGKEMAMIFQDPMTALNPLSTIGQQIEEPMYVHMRLTKNETKERALQLLRRVGIKNEERVYKQYPHELSGGMRQRVVIAIALACDPVLLIADEPTTALDVTIQAQIMDLLKQLQQQTKSGIILITHDLGVVAEMADRVAVMYAGEIVEIAPVSELFNNARHPYTRSLLHSIPANMEPKARLHVIQGIVPSIRHLKRAGCRFAPRIPWIPKQSHEQQPAMHQAGQDHWVRCTCHQHFYFPTERIGVETDDVLAVE